MEGIPVNLRIDKVSVVGCQYASAEGCAQFLKDKRHEERSGQVVGLQFVREPENPHDPNCIRVEYTNSKGGVYHVGYVATEWQNRVSRYMTAYESLQIIGYETWWLVEGRTFTDSGVAQLKWFKVTIEVEGIGTFDE
jgi:hypothetical protein